MTQEPIRLLLVGATGVVGREVLFAALADDRFGMIVAPTRRPLPPHPKLLNPLTDWSKVPDNARWWKVEAVICTLGTTLRKAGSEEAFAAVDRDLPVLVAERARAQGATRYALNSSLGAHPDGNFYLRTKAQAEEGVRVLSFPYFTVVRPSLIDARREERRWAEHAGLVAARWLRPLIPLRYRPVKPKHIAQALIEGVLRTEPGERIIESQHLHG